MSRWETHRGDEWWYADFWCEAEASVSSAEPSNISIERVGAKSGQLTEERLHHLLWLTQQQFSDLQVRCSLSPSLSTLLKELANKNLVNWRLLEHPYSEEALVSFVAEPSTEKAGRAKSGA